MEHTREWYEKHPKPCVHEGCTNKTWPAFYPDDEEEPIFVCDEHAYEEGFCFGCGGFWSGASEFFDFNLGGTHLCLDCHEEYRDEIESEADDEFYEYDPYD